jgi:hypothetical protein
MLLAELLQRAVELGGAARELGLGSLQLHAHGLELGLCGFEIRVRARQ